MAKQILRAFTMVVLIAGLGLVTAVVSAYGQSQLVVDIPFAFSVGDKALAPGEYTVRTIFDGGNGLVIREQVSNAAAMRLTHSIETSKAPERGKLVFRRYGDRYFLAEVWRPGENTGQQLLKSKQERAIEREQRRLAQNTVKIIELVATVR